jgi:hypothetical protein
MDPTGRRRRKETAAASSAIPEAAVSRGPASSGARAEDLPDALLVLLDHPDVVGAEADIDDCSAGPARLSMIALAFSVALALVVRAHSDKANAEK